MYRSRKMTHNLSTHADFDLDGSGNVRPSGWGGARRGAGAKPQGYQKPEEQLDYDKAKARNEAAKAALNELDFKVKSGEYVSRAAVRQATATVMASLVQGMRSLSDNLERQGLPPEWCVKVDEAVNASLSEVGAELELLGGD